MAGNDGTAGAVSAAAERPGQPRRQGRGQVSHGGRTARICCAAERDGEVAAGLVLEPAAAGDLYAVLVVDTSGRTLLRLGPWPQDEVIAIWRALGCSSGLPLIFSDREGRREQAFGQIGRLYLGTTRTRRRGALLGGRRPRFLVRRKTTRLPQRPLIYREQEIATGHGV